MPKQENNIMYEYGNNDSSMKDIAKNQYNKSLESLVVNTATSVNSNIVLQQKIDLLKFRIKYEKNIIKRKQLEDELKELLKDA